MDKIAVLDFGSQYAHLILNRIRRIGVFAEIFDPSTPAKKLKGYKGIIFSGGPQSVYDPSSPTCDPDIFKLKVPVLGICYGHQLIAHLLGGTVSAGRIKEYGKAKLNVTVPKGIFKGLKSEEQVWMSHGDEVIRLPEGFTAHGNTSDCSYAAYGSNERKIYGIQFHAEVTHTLKGTEIFENFLNLCRAKKSWNIKKYLARLKQGVRKEAKGKKVFMLVSGGVDSTVAFTLLQKVLGPKRVHGLFIDTGFLRLRERKNVEKMLEKLGTKNLHTFDAAKDFFAALEGVYEPEQKRRIIGDMFLTTQKKCVNQLKLDPAEWMLGQGTIYPDTIEAGGTRHADVIKTHHNRVPEIEELIKKKLVIEPLKELYKDEVRMVGEELGLPSDLVWRHPFPGPGLAVRCLCAKPEVKPPKEVSPRIAVEKRVNKLLEPLGMHGKILPIKSVGVQGDSRTYRHPVAIFGTASWEVLNDISPRITNSIPEVNRVLYACSPDTISSLTSQTAFLTHERIELLQKADDLSMTEIEKENLMFDIWQFPTVLIPVAVNAKKGESIVLRPVSSAEAMTANFYALDWHVVKTLTEKLLKLPNITGVFYDITNKPPGTIEWE